MIMILIIYIIISIIKIMDSNRLDVLESFSLISKIMPYFGSTHKSFLVLSRLNSKTRKKLDEYFIEFTRLMFANSLKILIRYDSIKWYDIP